MLRSAILRSVPDVQTSETPAAPTVFFRTLLDQKSPDLLNFCLTQFLFFYNLYKLPLA